jgi:hypothetical protein
MSDFLQCGHLPALEAVLAASRGVPPEALSTVEAEIAAAASPPKRPNRALRATDAVFAELSLYQSLCVDEMSHTGAFQETLEQLDRQREFFGPFGKPRRCRNPASEFDQLLRESANIAAPPTSSNLLPAAKGPLPATKKSLPDALKPKLADALRSHPHLTRPQQYEMVAELPQFRNYHLTHSVLREAGKVAPKQPGRPRKRQPE